MISPFSADSTYQTVKRGMSMVRAIKAGQILYAYTSSTGAVVDADTVEDGSAEDFCLFGLSAGDVDSVVQVTVPAAKAEIIADLVLTSGAVTDAAYQVDAEWSCGLIVFTVKSVSVPVEGDASAFTASMVLEAKVAGTTGNVDIEAALTTSATATNLTSAAVASIATPGAASYLATPLRSVDVVVSGAIDGAGFKDANGAAATNQEQDNLRKIGIFVL